MKISARMMKGKWQVVTSKCRKKFDNAIMVLEVSAMNPQSLCSDV